MKKYKKFIQPILIFSFLALFLSMCQRNKSLKELLNRHQDNLEVLNDSIKTIKNKNGELESSILGYKANAKELKLYNSKLAKQVKQEKGKVITLNNLVFHLKQDYNDLQSSFDSLKSVFGGNKVNDSLWVFNWTLPYYYNKDNYDIYSGKTYVTVEGNPIYIKGVHLKHNFTQLINRDSKMTLTWGQKYENGKVHVFAKTSHPAFKAQLLEGTYVDYPKKKHWFTGFGIGPNISMGYDFLHNKPAFMIGIGIQYNIYQW